MVVVVPGVPVYASDELAALKKRMQERFTDLTISAVRPSPIAGLYEMDYGTRTVLITADGRFLLAGELIDLDQQRNLTAERRAKLVLRAVDALGESKMIVMGPAKPKRTLTVFTDVDCPYCLRLHKDVPKLNEAGVRVRYLLYPRAGVNSETYRRSVAVWCAKDRIQAIGVAKAGGKLDMKTCPHPVDEHLKLGAEVGVEGTPALVFDDGKVVPGYMPAAQMLAALGLTHGGKDEPRR
jgi:thiol:disulfide interchange protein DsbC